MEKHGIDIGETTRSFDVVPKHSVTTMFEGMFQGVRQSRNRPIGFVIDADWTGIDGGGLLRRWEAVRRELEKLGLPASSLPDAPNPRGTIIDVPQYRTQAGFWFMPDNCRDGALEGFLAEAVVRQQDLFQHARQSTEVAKSTYQAQFREVDHEKASLYAFLAWQDKPGRPPGEAMAKAVFAHDGPTARAFVEWFRKLFHL